MKYTLQKTSDFVIDGIADKCIWQTVESLSINHWPWNNLQQADLPKVEVKGRYSSNGIYLLFNVQEKFLLATCTEYQDEVWFDSCVEFFVAPNSRGYFNFEINCIGTLLLHWNAAGEEPLPIPLSDISELKIQSSLENSVINEPIPCPAASYAVECFLPFHIFKLYANAKPPTTGVIWSTNFYKCGEDMPDPSWGAWSNISGQPEPSFHHPEFFGKIIFG